MVQLAEFEWDEDKRLSNFFKHGLDFRLAELLFDGRPIVAEDSSRNDERRQKSTAEVDGVFYTVIWTDRAGTIRIISLRRARDGEKRTYREIHGGRTAGDA